MTIEPIQGAYSQSSFIFYSQHLFSLQFVTASFRPEKPPPHFRLAHQTQQQLHRSVQENQTNIEQCLFHMLLGDNKCSSSVRFARVSGSQEIRSKVGTKPRKPLPRPYGPSCVSLLRHQTTTQNSTASA